MAASRENRVKKLESRQPNSDPIGDIIIRFINIDGTVSSTMVVKSENNKSE